ncbi:MAG: phosphopantothenate/pantothenate synthetase [Candidatus Heimdallarchaeota archaeon]|nr:phosphopantothenate/pantothenate synthetase [Candidatus Heimdallarchaeota archaeon]
MTDIPDDHPRAASLRTRHAIIEGMHKKIVAEAGLIAHGRGEAFDYLLGEQTHDFAKKAIQAAAAMLYLAKHPVLSVNGNVTALCPAEMVEFSNSSNIPLEINLFYRSEERVAAITEALNAYNPSTLYGNDDHFREFMDEISHARRVIDRRGIFKADVVFVPLEDGDRTIGLKKNNKQVITVDLNPLSRTAVEANITIVDNIIRVFPLLQEALRDIKGEEQARSILSSYDNNAIRLEAMETITSGFRQ